LCRARRKNCQGEFSFLSLHLWSKYTFEDLTNEQEMCSRKLEWKEMGFKVLKVTMSPRYMWMTRNRMHKTNYSKWMLYGLGKKKTLSRQPAWDESPQNLEGRLNNCSVPVQFNGPRAFLFARVSKRIQNTVKPLHNSTLETEQTLEAAA